MLVKIGTTDITKHILTSTYSMHEENVCYEWKDGNKVTHKDVIRQKISGSFALKFNTEEEYAAFVDLIEETRTTNYLLPMTVYVTNKNKEKSADMFYQFSPDVAKSKTDGKTYEPFRFEVEQP